MAEGPRFPPSQSLPPDHWLSHLLLSSPAHRRVLGAVADVSPSLFVGAGFVRNRVWDAAHGWQTDLRGSDVDVVHWEGDDRAVAAALTAALPGCPWEVVSQRPMAAAHGHRPYTGLAHALAHWPETATAVAVRLERPGLALIAPYGVDDLQQCVVRRSPLGSADAFAKRTLPWRARWPRLRWAALPEASP